MAKILISWMAFENDFLKGDPPVNPNGPTASVHKYFYNYDKHILLSTSSEVNEDTRLGFLVNFLRKNYSHQIEERFMNVTDVINLSEIQGKIDKLLLEHRKDEVEIFISPGTPTMQVAWYFAYLELGLNTKLFQIRQAKHTHDKKPEQIYVHLKRSAVTTGLIIKEELTNTKTDTKLLITPSIEPVYAMAEKIAATDNVTVLILGETGTGKEGLARFIHERSSRSTGLFIALNCSAMGESLLESRLFGYSKGSHNMAVKDKPGLFEDASGGTVFLDEIGDISPYMQQSLLRVLQEKEVSRIGESKERKIDVRIIAATNKNLLQLCKDGKYRFDLYYRLSVVELTLPTLAERGKIEIEQIFNFILEKKKKEFNRSAPLFSKEIKERLFCYSFPGNIRELENLIERMYAISDGEVTDNMIPPQFLAAENMDSLKLDDVIVAHIKRVYEMHNRNIAKTSRIIGKSPNTVKKKLNIK